MGRSTAAVAAETVAAWSPRRIGWPVVVGGSVVVVGGSVVVVVGSALVVVGSVVVGSTVVVGAVTIGWVVVAPNVVRAPVVVVRPTAAGAPVVAGRVVAVGPLAASGVVSGLVVDGAREVLGWGGRVVVDVVVGADPAGNVDSAPPGGRLGVGGAGSWGTRAAEATRAARTEAVRPKANSVSRQGRRGGSRCRGGRLGMAAVVPLRLVLPLLGCPPSARRTRPHRTWPRTTDRTARSCPSMRAGMMEPRGGRRRAGRRRAGTHRDPGGTAWSTWTPAASWPMTWPMFWLAQACSRLPGTFADLR
jgi:hypothetical protein